MPRNPFLQKQQNTSTTDVDRPVAVTPIPEHYKGYVLPGGRGTELHGVQPTADPTDPDDWDQRGVVVDLEPPSDEPDPIPVKIVTAGGEEFRRMRISTTFAGDSTTPGAPKSVVSDDRLTKKRTKVRIKNLSANTLYIGHSPETASPMHGWPLAQNEVFETTSHDAVWVGADPTTPPAAPSKLAVHTEFSITT